MRAVAAAFALVAAACTSSSPGPVEMPNEDLALPAVARDFAMMTPPLDFAVPIDNTPGADTTVVLFNKTLFSWDVTNDRRQSEAAVSLPPSGLYRQITLRIELTCPTDGCDPYDRRASIGIVDTTSGAKQYFEIGRFATPFGVGGAWNVDVTDLRPLLSGSRTVHGFIDTWVGNGQGWLLTAKLIYVGGVPARVPVAVLPLPWNKLPPEDKFPIGDPSHPVSGSLPAQTVTLPPGATHAAVRVTVTGHGQGNNLNCGEFCSLTHTLLVDGAAVQSRAIWRSDCDQNPINNQGGTWKYARANWCPGADVKPWLVDLGGRTAPLKLTYGVSNYVNTCSPSNCNQSTCALGTGCNYDSGLHTEPIEAFSALVIVYR
jgi:hypothetical protein